MLFRSEMENEQNNLQSDNKQSNTPRALKYKPTGVTAKGERLTLEQVQARIKNINFHINSLKIFVVIFCLVTVLLNAYHINRLKVFSQALSSLMKTHGTSLKMLNVLDQIKQNRGYATGGRGYNPPYEDYNTTVNTFYTNGEGSVTDEYILLGMTER